MRIHLGGRDAGVPQHVLHRAQVAARLQQVGGEGVAQRVGVHLAGQPELGPPLLESQLHRAGTERRAVARHKQRPSPGTDQCLAFNQPRLERRLCETSDRHDARLRALAGDAHRGVLEIDVVGRERDKLGEPQPRGIEQLEHRPVAHRERIAHADLHQPSRLVRRQRMRQPLRGLGRPDAETGVVREPVIAGEVVEEAAPRREHARQRPAVQPSCVQLRHTAAHLGRLQLLERNGACQLEQRGDVARVVFDGVPAQPALVGEMLEIATQQALRGSRFRVPGSEFRVSGVRVSAHSRIASGCITANCFVWCSALHPALFTLHALGKWRMMAAATSSPSRVR